MAKKIEADGLTDSIEQQLDDLEHKIKEIQDDIAQKELKDLLDQIK